MDGRFLLFPDNLESLLKQRFKVQDNISNRTGIFGFLNFKTNHWISNKVIGSSLIFWRRSKLTNLDFNCSNNSSKLSGWPQGELGDKSEKPFWLLMSLFKASPGFSWFPEVFETGTSTFLRSRQRRWSRGRLDVFLKAITAKRPCKWL